MNKRRLLVAVLALGSFGGSCLQAQVLWTAPTAPGQDLTTLSQQTDVYVYNIEAEAVLTRGYNYETKAIANQLENGDASAGAGRQVINIIPDGEKTIKIHVKDRAADVFFGQDDSENAAAMWSDLGNAGDRVRFTFEASPNYPNAYTLKNVARQKLLDVMFLRGGKTTLYAGKGFTDWTFITKEDIEAGKLRQFKARKAMWGLYKALEKSNALAANATALDAANTVYTNAEASADDLRAAFRTLFVAVAGSIEEPVDASYLFDHPDMASDKSIDQWNWQAADGTPDDRKNAAYGAGEYERWHAAFTANQTQTVPNGLYDIRFMGMYRQDEGDTTAPKLIVATGEENTNTANFPNMEQLGGYWNVSNGASWANSATGQRPDQMWTASDALALDQASALVENVKVKNGQMGIMFSATSTGQWFNWHRVIVTYKGAVALALYKSLQAKIAEGEAYNEPVAAPFKDAIAQAVVAAKTLTAESTEEEITAAINAIDNAIKACNGAPLQKSVDMLNATIALAEAEGVDATAAKALVEAVATATDKQFNDTLYKLRAARKLNAATKIDVANIEGSEPANGDFYLLNVGTGLFLNTTADWGCHISIDNPGMLVTLTQDGTGTDNIPAFKMSGNGWSGLNWNEEYWDKNGEHKSAFRPVAGKEKVYYWNVFDNFRWHFVYDVNDGACDGNTLYWNAVQKREKDAADYENDLNAQWKLVTKAQLLAYMQKATNEAPVDATFLINNPNFTKFNGQEVSRGWTGVGGVMTAERNPYYVVEFYQSDANMKQTIEGLPAGIYKVSVNGFYRDGNSDDETKKVNNKQELNHTASLVAINGSDVKVEATLPNVTSGAGTMPGVGEVINGLEIPNWPVQANEYFQSGLYKTTTGSIIVGEDGKLTIGIENTNNGNAGNWIVIDNFRLTYFGTQIDLTEFLNALNTAISDAQAFDATTTTAPVANALSQALTNAIAAREATNSEDIITATTNLRNALNTAKAVNIVALKATVDLAKSEKDDEALSTVSQLLTDATGAAETAVAEATTAQAVEQALFDLTAARKINALTTTATFKGSAPAAGKVYLFNVGTGMFLGTGSDWNTHAAVDQVGIEIELVDLDNPEINNFKFRTGRGGGWMAYNGYVDTNGQDIWHFLPVDGKEGVYNISSTGQDGYLLGYNPNKGTDGKKYWSNIGIDQTGLDNPMNQWMVITPAERAAMIKAASVENPVDVSYLIKNASLNRQDGYDMYTKACEGGNGGARVSTTADGDGNRAADYAYEFFEPTSFSFSQNLTGLKAGKYIVMVQGFFRNGNGDAQREAFNNGSEPVRLAYLFANNEEEQLANITEELDLVPALIDVMTSDKGAFPNMPNAAIEYFQHGAYWNAVEVEVGTDGQLTIGVKKNEKQLDGDWTVIDNFRLIYMGNPALETAKSELSTLIQTAKGLDTTGKTESSVSNLNSAITNAETALAAEDATVESLTTAKTNLQTAIDNLEDFVDGINAIEAAAKAGKMFNAQGQQVNKAKKGVYIINKKKMVVK
ncbi:FIVAR domain-containing protein [Prevotella sp. E13-17]|uniref:FIVAR domain-containing protein n=1 Tax=Prevotella sp. E13-17 TaxID=2913616 RepID=UPI001EDA23C3|nr:FIVAR domain-containing protein [Prevotella sp. E13-17]UKK51675.1 FIVAR domain-containing protein [Prevotella sp. E13-17]